MIMQWTRAVYYLVGFDPLATLRHYLQAAEPCVAIISIYTTSRRSRVIAAQIRSHTRIISETTTRQDGKEWVCLVVDRVS